MVDYPERITHGSAASHAAVLISQHQHTNRTYLATYGIILDYICICP